MGREAYATVAGYSVVIEVGPPNCCGSVPDLPGCIATGRTERDVIALMETGIPFHIEGLQQDGDPVPPPVTTVETLAARERAASEAARPASAGRAVRRA